MEVIERISDLKVCKRVVKRVNDPHNEAPETEGFRQWKIVERQFLTSLDSCKGG